MHAVPRLVRKREKDGGERWNGKAHDSVGVGVWGTRNWEGKGLEILWFDHLGHAQVFDP
jgi:hypothetical protein